MCKLLGVCGDGAVCVLRWLLFSRKDRMIRCCLPDKQSQIKQGADCVRRAWVACLPCGFHVLSLTRCSARSNWTWSIQRVSTQPAFLHSCPRLLPFVHILMLTLFTLVHAFCPVGVGGTFEGVCTCLSQVTSSMKLLEACIPYVIPVAWQLA